MRRDVRDGKYVGESTFTLSGQNREVNLTVNFITPETIRDKSWLMLYNHLQTGTYALSEDSIFSAMNDKIIADEGYPLVIIEPPKVENVKQVINRDGIRQKMLSFTIMVYATSAQAVKILADEVENKLDSGWRSLAASGLKNLEFPDGDYDWYTEGSKKVHVYVIPVLFKYTRT